MYCNVWLRSVPPTVSASVHRRFFWSPTLGATLGKLGSLGSRIRAGFRSKQRSLDQLFEFPLGATSMRKLSAFVLGTAVLGAFIVFISQAPGAASSFRISLPGPVPLSPAFVLKDVEPRQAMEINRRIPFAPEPNPPARSFKLRGDDLEYVRALECLTSTIHYEAAHEGEVGHRAVAQVVLNRVRHPAFPKSVCGVTYEGSTRRTGCQFSFTCDGALGRPPHPVLWNRARTVAAAALQGSVFAPVGYATHYHANYVVPYWATSLAKNANIGTHIFYRWPGWWGQPAAFRKHHAGKEPDPKSLRHTALRLPGLPLGQDLALGTDPRVELISIIHLLAEGVQARENLSQYERDVLGHFGDYADHEAVRIYRGLQADTASVRLGAVLSLAMNHSAPPEMEAQGRATQELIASLGGAEAYDSFIPALQVFGTDSGFARFYEKRLPYFAKLRDQSWEPTLRLFATVERETDGAVPRFRLLLSPLLKNAEAFSGCEPLARGKPQYWLLVAPTAPGEVTFKVHAKLAKQILGITASPSRIARELRSCSQPAHPSRSSVLRLRAT